MATEDVVGIVIFAVFVLVVITIALAYDEYIAEPMAEAKRKADREEEERVYNLPENVAKRQKEDAEYEEYSKKIREQKARAEEAQLIRMNEIRAKYQAEAERKAEELAKKQYATRKREVMAKWSVRKAEQSNKRILDLQISQLDYSKMETYAGDRIRSWEAYTSAIHVKCEDSYEIIADLTQFQVTGVREYFPARGMFSVNYPYELYSEYETSHEGQALSGHE